MQNNKVTQIPISVNAHGVYAICISSQPLLLKAANMNAPSFPYIYHKNYAHIF